MADSQPISIALIPQLDGSTVEYREIVGFPGYAVGSDGSVWSCKKRGCRPGFSNWRKLAQPRDTNGYCFVTLFANRVKTLVSVHRLVLEAFVGPCPDGMEACHDPDRSKDNNHVGNLRWGSHADNMADQIKHGTKRRGERCPRAKLTDELVISIRELRGEMSTLDIAKRVGVSVSLVRAVHSGTTWGWMPLDSSVSKRYRPRGEELASKLTEVDVRNILSLRNHLTRLEISKMYGVSIQNVSFIMDGRTWRHIDRGALVSRPYRRKVVDTPEVA